MVTGIFKLKGVTLAVITVGVLLWIVFVTFLLYHYGVRLSVAFVDSFLTTVFVIAGWLLLENVFKFYTPKKSNYWLIVFLPLVISFLITLVLKFVLPALIEDLLYTGFLYESIAVRGAMIFILFIAFTIIAVIYNRLEDQFKSKEREEGVLKMSREAELYHLRSQLQPHFLFNSLNSINALMISHPESARQMVFQLSDFLRGTIRKGAEQWVYFPSELHTLTLYLDIEKVRFGHRLAVDIQADPNTDAMLLPALLLQPLVENAVKFGLYGLVGEVSISLMAISKGGNLYIEITNPFDPTDTPPKGSGFGLSAVTRRLYLLFGRHDLLETNIDHNIFKVKLNIPQLR
ncbi:sensor histidine kinase [Anditalea andensis]|uniref:Signal transduction histidine kinase internal region domain-containing protein n=1 Tax=Anditalea andensis TaxID=1048983 RepID=A0A074L3F6_9BACT|nr:histidine kinase [Anditalea andensis]KEO74393.1 hypothetical protein EL17_06560 [Anditalea andensis]